jgi:hypothetical protein
MTKTIALAAGFAGLAIVTAPRIVLAEEPSLATVMQARVEASRRRRQ